MNEARIKLAQAMNRNQGPLSEAYEVITNKPIFDPFTDANDDYAVLAFVSENWTPDQFIAFRCALRDLRKNDASWHGSMYTWNYQIGDYARAACKVLGIELEAVA